MAGFELHCLGDPVLLDHEGQALSDVPRDRKALAVLIYLALAQRPVWREDLAGELWPDAETRDAARESLRKALSRIRKWLGTDAVGNRDRVGLIMTCVDAVQKKSSKLNAVRTQSSQNNLRDEYAGLSFPRSRWSSFKRSPRL